MKRLLLTLFCGCAAQPASTSTFSREAMIADVVTYVILPNYADFVAKTQALADAIPTAPVATLQEKWNAAYLAFKRTEVHAFGPVSNNSLDAAVAAWPTADTAVLDEEAATVTTKEQVDAKGSLRKGLAVLEYVLWDARFEERRTYAGALAQAAANGAVVMEAAWTGGYADAFLHGTDPLRNLKECIDLSFNYLIGVPESVAKVRFDAPAGVLTGAMVPQPALVESRFSGKSLAHALATLDGIERFFAGVDGHQGMGAIVLARNPALHQRVLDTFAETKTALLAINDPLSTRLTDSAAQVARIATAFRAIRNLLGTEVANTIGVTVTYSDNDGD